MLTEYYGIDFSELRSNAQYLNEAKDSKEYEQKVEVEINKILTNYKELNETSLDAIYDESDTLMREWMIAEAADV